MKKTIIAFSLVLALIVAGPVAASGIDFGGTIETNIEVNKKDDDLTVTPASELNLNMGIKAADDKVRARVQFGLSDEYPALMPDGISLGDITLKQAFIEADGPYWHGGPEATTRFGTLDIGFSPYAAVKDHSGISVTGIDLDLVQLGAFYGLPGANGHVLGLRADLGLLDEVDLGASVISDQDLIRLQADAATRPMDGLQIAGAVAVDHTDEEGMNNLWTVKADYELMENMNVAAGYKYMTEDWEPRYVSPQSKDDEPDEAHDWIYMEQAQNHGLFVEFNTAQQGVNIFADYDQMFASASVGADTEYEGFRFDVKTELDVPSISEMSTRLTSFGVERDVDIMDGLVVTAGYNGEWVPGEQLTHTIGASTILGLVPAIDGLSLNGEVSFSELNIDSVGYKVGAEFAAPNGVNLGIEHDRYDGTTFQAGMKVNF